MTIFEQYPLILCWETVRQYLAATAPREFDASRAELDVRLLSSSRRRASSCVY